MSNGKPPVEHQFKKGNKLGGRPKGKDANSLFTSFRRLLEHEGASWPNGFRCHNICDRLAKRHMEAMLGDGDEGCKDADRLAFISWYTMRHEGKVAERIEIEDVTPSIVYEFRETQRRAAKRIAKADEN